MILQIVFFVFLAQTTTASWYHLESDQKCIREMCPVADYFRYYNCSGTRCDFHLQPWVFVIVATITILFLCSVVCSLLNCVCCSRRER